jgi:hypothetical protein
MLVLSLELIRPSPFMSTKRRSPGFASAPKDNCEWMQPLQPDFGKIPSVFKP